MSEATPDADLPVSETEAVWLAGLLEGEGAFDVSKGAYPRVRLAMTDRDTVSRAAALMGTTVRLSLHDGTQPLWHTETTGTVAARVMRTVLPYMGTRRSQQIASALSTAAFREHPDRARLPGPRLEGTTNGHH